MKYFDKKFLIVKIISNQLLFQNLKRIKNKLTMPQQKNYYFIDTLKKYEK